MLRNSSISKQYISCIAMIFTIILLITVEPAFTAQELKVGFIEGRGDDAAFEQQAFEAAEVEYEVISEQDYQLANLLEFDVIAVGVVAYDQNEGLKANFELLKEYIERGGYLVTADFQQDSTWDAKFFPHPLKLFDDDLDEGAGVKIIDAPLWHKPNEIKDEHFIGWGAGDFMADGPHEVKKPWEPLLLAGGNDWPVVVGAKAGRGYVVFNSLQILQALGRTGNELIAEVFQNFLFWRGPMAVRAEGKIAATWAELKY
jgi:hypothetical protein